MLTIVYRILFPVPRMHHRMISTKCVGFSMEYVRLAALSSYKNLMTKTKRLYKAFTLFWNFNFGLCVRCVLLNLFILIHWCLSYFTNSLSLNIDLEQLQKIEQKSCSQCFIKWYFETFIKFYKNKPRPCHFVFRRDDMHNEFMISTLYY